MTKLAKILQFYRLTNEVNIVKLSEQIGIERRRLSKIEKGGMPTGEELTKINAWMLS